MAASTASPLTEATLDGSIVTLTLQDRFYKPLRGYVGDFLKVSGIAGVTFKARNTKYVSDTEATVELDFDGTDFDGTGHKLTFTLEADAIANYEGPVVTAELAVSGFDESVTASVRSPLTEATLNGSIVTLTLHGGRVYETLRSVIAGGLKVSGIAGVSVSRGSVRRVSDTVVTVELDFNDNIDTTSTLTFDVEGAIANYKGPAVTAELPVSASDESVVASTTRPLTEATLDGNTVTLTLQGRTYETSRNDIARNLKVSGITGATFRSTNVQRISDTVVTVELDFNRDIDTDSTLTFTVSAGAIANYEGSALTTELHVSAFDESVAASTARPLTEAMLDGSLVTLTLRGGRIYARDVSRYLRVSGIAGVTDGSVERVSDTVATVELDFNGNIDTAATLTFTVNAGAIANYEGSALTTELPVSASDESVRAAAARPLTEATLDGSIVTLTLHGRVYETSRDVSRYLEISGIAGVTFTSHNVQRVSDTEATVELDFDDKDFDGTGHKLTFTVKAGAIAGYDGPTLMVELPVSASDESVRAAAANPLTEATLDGNTVTLTLHGGRIYESRTVASHLKVSGIRGATFTSHNVQRVSDTVVTVRLNFDGTDFDGTGNKLTFTVNAGAIANYKGAALTAELPVSASDESVRASSASPLTEATLDGNIVTLTLHGGRIYKTGYISQNLIKVSGIAGVTVDNVSRGSNTEVAVELDFSGDINTATTLTFTVEAGAIENYKGPALTAELPVFGGDEYVVASAARPLTEATLDGNIVTLTLHGGRIYETGHIASDLKVSGISGVTPGVVNRLSDTEATVQLNFDGSDFEGTGNKLTFTVEAGAIANYKGSALTVELRVSADDESVRASAASPLTEATLDGNIVTLTLHGRTYSDYSTLRSVGNLKVSGIPGVTFTSSNMKRVSDTVVTIELDFNGNIDTAATLTFTLNEGAIANYKGSALTTELPVFGGNEYVVASAARPLTEATLDGNIVTLTLHGGRIYETGSIASHLRVSGISGVTPGVVNRLSDTEITVLLNFDGSDFDRNTRLTFRVSSGAIENYNGSDLTVELPVTATVETLPPVEVEAPKTDTPDFVEPAPTTPVATEVETQPSVVTEKRVENRVVNQRSEDIYVIYSTWQRRTEDLPEGYVTRGHYVIAPGEQRSFYTLPNNSIYFRILQFGEAIKPQDSTSTFPFWIHLTKGFNLVSPQFNHSVSKNALTYSDQVRSELTHADGFMEYPSGSRVHVTPAWVKVNVAAPIQEVSVDAGDSPPMYWIDTDAGTLHRLVDAEVENLVPSVRNATSLTVDVANNKLYWTEKTSNTTGKIRRANLDGRNVALVRDLTSVPFDMTLDAANGKLYLTNSWGKVQRLNSDGSGFQPNLVTGLDTPTGIAVDVAGRQLYWTEKTGNTTGKIWRANLDGTNVQLLRDLASVPLDIAVDTVDGKLYVTNSLGNVQRLNFDGSGFQANFITGLDTPMDIAIDTAGRKLYLTSPDGKISRRNLNGSGSEAVVTDLRNPGALVLGGATTPTETTTGIVTTHPQPSIYWVAWSAGRIERASLEGSNVTDVVDTGSDEPSGLAIDVSGGKIYWTAFGEWDALGYPIPATGKIQCADLDGSNVQDLLTGLDFPQGIALDVAGGKMYWTSQRDLNPATQTLTSKIQSADLDGSNVRDLVTGSESPRGGIALDVAAGKMYWTDWSKIQSADLDGSNVRTLVPGLSNLSGIALDVAAGKMYWPEVDWENLDGSGAPTDKIQSADLDGSNVRDLITGLDATSGGIALDVERGKIYWGSEKYDAQTDSFTSKIQSANLDGSSVTDFLTGLYFPSVIALGIPPQTAGEPPVKAAVTPATTDRAEDVNQDGKVDNVDLEMVAAALFGGNPPATPGRLDVNGDGALTIDDLTQISNNLDEDDAAAPALGVQRNALESDKIQAAIDRLLATGDGSIGVRRTLTYLQTLLAAARPDETRLLANYPNPFNPETWLPYALATDSDVTLILYDASGKVIRRLALGYQSAGYYTSRSRAAYWDGRNAQGERVASGLYFYTLTTGNFSATRRMLILK